MTCIVGLESGENVYIGADSAATSGVALCVRADTKVFRNGPFLIGFTTSFRMGQLLQFKLEPPDHPAGMSTFEFLVTLFVDRVRSCLRTGGFAKRKEEQELAGSFLLGYRGSLYSMDSDYQVASAADGISAVGCGAHIALGALHALNAIAPLNPDKLTPHKRLEIALDAAERWNSAVRSPFVILSN